MPGTLWLSEGGGDSYERGIPATVHDLVVVHEQTLPGLHITECIDSMVLEGQLPHKIVNLLFTVANSHSKLTALWGR